MSKDEELTDDAETLGSHDELGDQPNGGESDELPSQPADDVETVDEMAGSDEREVMRDERPRRSRLVLVLVVVVILIVLSLLGGGRWLWTELEALRGQMASVESRSAAKTEELAEAQSRQRQTDLGQTEQQLEAANARVASLDARIETLNLRLVEAEQSKPEALAVAELEYLLQLANNRLQLESDRAGALLALDRSLSRLEAMDSPVYAPLMATIAAERAGVVSAPAPGLEAVVERLSALLERVDDIVVDAQKLTPDPQAPAADARTQTGWQALMASVTQNLGQFVTVHRADGAAAPTLIPDQHYYARENIRLSLQSARSSALRGDSRNYRLSLDETSKWLEHFPPKAEVVVHIETEVEALRNEPLVVTLPDVSGSLSLLRNLAGKRFENADALGNFSQRLDGAPAPEEAGTIEAAGAADEAAASESTEDSEQPLDAQAAETSDSTESASESGQ